MTQKTLLKFTAPWCGACRALTPTITAVLKDFPDIILREIDVDKEPGEAAKHHVTSLPMLVYGDRVHRGTISTSALRDFLSE